MSLERIRTVEVCPKCGTNFPEVRFFGEWVGAGCGSCGAAIPQSLRFVGGPGEHLQLTCRCGYVWRRLPLDARV